MMARRTILAVLTLGISTLLVGCRGTAGSHYRFKLTIEIETPNGLKSGSSIYEVSARNKFGFDPSGSVREWTVEGQAVLVDLGSGKALLGLLKTVNSSGHDDLAFTSMTAFDPKFKYDYVESAERIAAADGIRSTAQAVPSNYPMMIGFHDLDDPATMVRLDPHNLATELGSGLQLKQVFVELTDEPVTKGIEKRLTWLPSVYEKLRGRSFRPEGIPLGNLKGLFASEYGSW